MWHETVDVEQWLAAASDIVFPAPGRHTIPLTLMEYARSGGQAPRMAYWHDGYDVTGAAVWAADYPVVLCEVPDEAMRPLGELWPFEAVSGRTELAVQLAKVVAGDRTVVVHGAERLFRLEQLVVPDVPGFARKATAADEDLLAAWFDAFLEEARIAVRPDSRVEVRERTAAGRLTVWDHGGPVAMAGRHGLAFGGVRIGPVYTPPERRWHGYGAGVTAAVSQEALDLGAHEVVLFTDLTNPTSNALYPKLGYRPVEDRAVVRLVPASEPAS